MIGIRIESMYQIRITYTQTYQELRVIAANDHHKPSLNVCIFYDIVR